MAAGRSSARPTPPSWSWPTGEHSPSSCAAAVRPADAQPTMGRGPCTRGARRSADDRRVPGEPPRCGVPEGAEYDGARMPSAVRSTSHADGRCVLSDGAWPLAGSEPRHSLACSRAVCAALAPGTRPRRSAGRDGRVWPRAPVGPITCRAVPTAPGPAGRARTTPACRPGEARRDYTGPCTITAPNTVIDGKTVNCSISSFERCERHDQEQQGQRHRRPDMIVPARGHGR